MGAYPTLLDIAIQNAGDRVAGLIDETMKAVPEVRLGAARTIPGTNYNTLVRTVLPTTGFRGLNSGTPTSKGVYENRLVNTFVCNPIWEADKAIADAYVDGAQAYIALEGSGMVLSAFQMLSKQFYYGANEGGDTLGHPGLLHSYDTNSMVVDAGGTTANTGGSVWAVKFGPTYCQWVMGNNGSLMVADVIEQILFDANNNPYPAYIQSMLSWIGLQVGNLKCVARIKKLTADVGHTLNDALIGQLLSKFPVGYVPDVLFMSRRSLEQLRESRTATNPTGEPAPTPTQAHNVPIAATDGILDTESLTL